MNKNHIVYYTGIARVDEEWTPDSLKTGIGGSETAVIYLAKEWMNLGYTVTVYSHCGDREGSYDGVEYLNYQRFDRNAGFDTLIIWREPELLEHRFNANRVWLDLHDLPDSNDYTLKRINHVNKIFAKSVYQRNLLPDIPDDRFIIIPNGVDQRILQWSETQKDPYKLIYASGYGRGLELMLMYGWSIIKREIPEAHLHIYYGWDSYDAAFGDNPEYLPWKQKMIELMQQPGITEHGRVGQTELIQDKATATIHYYAATLAEIDSISVRESAMVGCVPVTTDYGALSEKDYCIKVPGYPQDFETQESVAEKVVELLRNPTKLEQIRQRSKALARISTWDQIAKQWLRYLSA